MPAGQGLFYHRRGVMGEGCGGQNEDRPLALTSTRPIKGTVRDRPVSMVRIRRHYVIVNPWNASGQSVPGRNQLRKPLTISLLQGRSGKSIFSPSGRRPATLWLNAEQSCMTVPHRVIVAIIRPGILLLSCRFHPSTLSAFNKQVMPRLPR